MDAAEAPNGIACAGGMAADNPLCSEQFKNSSVAALKVVPDAGHLFAYWEMNGGIIQQASAEPLFLSAMPRLAGIVGVPADTKTATMRPCCLSLTLQSVTFTGTAAELLQDDGTPYRATPDTPHWQKTGSDSSRSFPVVLTAGNPIAVTATFAVEPADFAGDLYIMGTGADAHDASHRLVFAPQNAALADGIASVTLSAAPTARRVDVFDAMRLEWAYGVKKQGAFTAAPVVSEHQVYVTWAPPLASSLYHTLVHLVCKAAKGVTGTPRTDDHLVMTAIWEHAFDREKKTQPIRRMSDGRLLTYYGFFDSNKNGAWDNGLDTDKNDPDKNQVTDAATLIATGNGQCLAWAEFLYEALKAQGIKTIKNLPIEKVNIKKKLGNDSFAVKEWSTSASSTSQWIVNPLCRDAGMDGANAKAPAAGEACDAPGVSGQGASPNPPADFENHYIVYMNFHFYDPSYGLGPIFGEKAYEDAAFAGRLFYDGNPPKLYIGRLPLDNDDPLDETDF